MGDNKKECRVLQFPKIKPVREFLMREYGNIPLIDGLVEHIEGVFERYPRTIGIEYYIPPAFSQEQRAAVEGAMQAVNNNIISKVEAILDGMRSELIDSKVELWEAAHRIALLSEDDEG